jgi:hypothetical protein
VVEAGVRNLATLEVVRPFRGEARLKPATPPFPHSRPAPTSGAPWPANLKPLRAADNYYATTLQLLSLVAVRMGFPSCLRE